MSKQVGKSTLVFGVMILVGLIIGVAVLVKLNVHKTTPKTSTLTIQITDNGFEPSTVLISKGTKVTWVNNTVSPKEVAANPFKEYTSLPSLKSEALGPNDKYSYTFNKSGTVNYHDDLNPTTNAQIIVK